MDVHYVEAEVVSILGLVHVEGILTAPGKSELGLGTVLPHAHLPSPTASLFSGQTLAGILARAVQIHSTRRERGMFLQSPTIRVGSAGGFFG